MSSLKDFVLVHKIWKDNYEDLEKDDFIMKGKVNITKPNWKLPSYLNYWSIGKSPSKNKQIYFSLLSKDIKYDLDFAKGCYLLYLDPKIIKDYSDKVHITPRWAFGVELSDTLYYNSKKTLLQNLRRFNREILRAIGKDNDLLFQNEVVIEIDEIDIKKYILDIEYI
jgi:hypothetical protein